MFRNLGTWVVRFWHVLLAGWIIALVALKLTAPAWDSVLEQGEFAFLPKSMPSLQAENLYEQAWGEPFASNIVLVVRRERTQLTEQDRDFISRTLTPQLQAIIKRVGLPSPTGERNDAGIATPTSATVETAELDLSQVVKTFATPGMKKILDSVDGTATMVVIDLQTEFLDATNGGLIKEIEDLIRPAGALYKTSELNPEPVPAGLHLALSGSATVGRDMMKAASDSSKATELWTTILVVILLIGIYRAPVLALIPLITVGVATEFSLALLATLAKHNILTLFNGIEVYVKVLSYGAGVDYCLFLIARFKEELEETPETPQAVTNSLAKAGEALVASAGTVICGIFMMVFAQFGKFQQAGLAITLGLVVVLAASLTFTPALLRMFGKLAFWPQLATTRVERAAGWVSATRLFSTLFRKNTFEFIWQKTSELIQARPGQILTASFVAMAPLAIVAVVCFDNLSYGLLTELPQDNASVLGARVIQDHYPAGIAGPVTLLIHHPGMNFRETEGQEAMEKLVQSLYSRKDELKLADIRSVAFPFGIANQTAADAAEADAGEDAEQAPSANPLQRLIGNGGNLIAEAAVEKVTQQKARDYYIGRNNARLDPVSRGVNSPGVDRIEASSITRLDLVSLDDPFSRDSIQQFINLRETVHTLAARLFDNGSEVSIFAIGPTASLRDLKTVTDRDQRVVDALVLGGIFLILIVLLKQFIIPVYLIVSVFFSYLVTLGATFAFFWMLDPSGFTGLDWKVPTFLFTILIAVGEDYNIFLMTRIREEQDIHGQVPGVGIALTKTGSIISSCGIIMAGTFSSLMAGTLVGMHQLGFALAFGVLLDTFVVRPILVPAFLVLLYQGRFRGIAQSLGLASVSAAHPADDVSTFESRGNL